MGRNVISWIMSLNFPIMSDSKPNHITSNQAPEKTNFLSRTFRQLGGIAPLLRLVPMPLRPMGISVMTRVKDEADWIEPSIRSIMRIADEIVIVDNGSTDGTYEILEDIFSREKGMIKLWRLPDLNLCELSNFALNQTRFQWVLKWDGDMVARISGNYDIRNLRERLLSLDPRRYYIIYLRQINLAGDLFHQDPDEMVHIEEYIHTFSDKSRYIHPGRYEAIKFPKYYQPLFWYEPYSFHVNVKPARRMLLRYFWEDWMALKDYQRFPKLEDYVSKKIREVFGTDSWEEAQKLCVQKVCRDYIAYDSGIFGPYPNLLRPHLANPKYRLIYESGKIVGRYES